jgi:hypothetical protein
MAFPKINMFSFLNGAGFFVIVAPAIWRARAPSARNRAGQGLAKATSITFVKSKGRGKHGILN